MSKLRNNLLSARLGKKDEFYTPKECIDNELYYYRSYFFDKIIYLNCDDEESEFFKFFKKNFNEFNLSSLIATKYSQSSNGIKYELRRGCNEVKRTVLEDNGSFNSVECLKELESCDIVITNPPFSLWREYINILSQYKKDFVVLGGLNALSYKNVFTMFINGNIRLGYGRQNITYYFSVPDSYEIRTSGYKVDGVKRLLPVMNCCWFTNIFDLECDENRVFQFNARSPKFSERIYEKYLNYDAINVNRVRDIPIDYFGVMGVPLTYACVHNKKLFDIIGSNSYNVDDLFECSLYHSNEHGDIVHLKKNGNSLFVKKDSVGGKTKKIYWDDENNKYVAPYARLFIRRKIDS